MLAVRIHPARPPLAENNVLSQAVGLNRVREIARGSSRMSRATRIRLVDEVVVALALALALALAIAIAILIRSGDFLKLIQDPGPRAAPPAEIALLSAVEGLLRLLRREPHVRQRRAPQAELLLATILGLLPASLTPEARVPHLVRVDGRPHALAVVQAVLLVRPADARTQPRALGPRAVSELRGEALERRRGGQAGDARVVREGEGPEEGIRGPHGLGHVREHADVVGELDGVDHGARGRADVPVRAPPPLLLLLLPPVVPPATLHHGLVALDLPALDHGHVEQPAADRGGEEDAQRQRREARRQRERRERHQLRRRRPQVRREVPRGPERGEPLPHEVAEGPERRVRVREEPQEVRERLQRDAVARPRTVVVHLRHAAAAALAVVRARRLRGRAFAAPAAAGGGADAAVGRVVLAAAMLSGYFGTAFILVRLVLVLILRAVNGGILVSLALLRSGLSILFLAARPWEFVPAGIDGAGTPVRPPQTGQERVEDAGLRRRQRSRLEVWARRE